VTSDKDEEALDSYEGFPTLYGKREFIMRIKMDGRTEVTARVYYYHMMRQDSESAPSPGYHECIAQGYADWKMTGELWRLKLAREEAHKWKPKSGRLQRAFGFIDTLTEPLLMSEEEYDRLFDELERRERDA